ncbi:ATP-binding protein [Aneurinibacillus sp. Ricciae_BoGa-3]|uniref:ATP-binding protein n=1 Tax=Aneurinibacillus sp. Ricciae_BoGa-3 TaxID=3022697 RepID=UPI0023419917|nr:ATP-binding protein [Aneurinibacillus sp. Ricciae_BoGa-3]WCK56497.1 ATP-binding protein [Aneurinibacillus sp. Ricciae_BoGa-3]
MISEQPLFIQISNQKCHNLGLNPQEMPRPHQVSKEEIKEKQARYKEILDKINFVANKMLFFSNSNPMVLLVTDDELTVLDLYGDESIINSVNKIGINIGIRFNREQMGTSSVCLAMEHMLPVKLIGSDHFHDHLSNAACYTVPFTYRNFDNLSGTLTIFTNINNANNIYLGMLSVIVDSVERELLLHKQNQKLFLLNQIMMRSTKNGIILTDNEGTILDINDSTEKIAGLERKRMIGRSIVDFKPVGLYMMDTLEHQKINEDIFIELQTAEEGVATVCLLDTIPIYDEKNKLSGAYGQFRDITDRHNLEKQIITAEKFSAIGKLSAGFAHEIRNPLTSISGFIHLFKEELPPDDSKQHYLGIIQSELERVKKLVTDFIVVAKPDTPVRTSQDISQLLLETVHFMYSQAVLRNVEIHFTTSYGSIMLSLDAMQIKQVLINLMQNAIDAMPTGGHIYVSLREFDEHNIQIDIKDTGFGMERHELQQIMNPFFTTKEDGLGLGLSISYRIIESHNGKMMVFSEKGVGTTFTILLPKK